MMTVMLSLAVRIRRWYKFDLHYGFVSMQKCCS